MIITCPACETRYYAGETSLGNRTRQVKCAKCGHKWTVVPDGGWSETPEDEPEAQPWQEPVRRIVDPLAEGSEPEAPSLRSSGAAEPPEAMDIYASPKPRSRILDRIVTAILAVMILTGLVAAAIQYRTEIVRAWPVLAGVYAEVGMPVNVSGLEIKNPAWKVEDRNGVPFLVVSAEVQNTRREPVTLPRVNFVLRDKTKHELYRWNIELPRPELGPGQSLPFTSHLQSPPKEAHDVQIGFQS